MKLEEIPENYDKAAPYYDFFTDLMFRYVLGVERYRRRAVELLGNIEGARVLDIGCGTGRNFPLLVDRVGASGQIVAVDYSEGMLNQARRRVESHGWKNISLVRGDAATLKDIDPSFDAIVSIWCLGIVYDLCAAINRASDLLAPEGRLAVMDFYRSRPDSGPLRCLYPVYSRLLQAAGIDTKQDLENARLQQRWDQGIELLHQRLDNVDIEWYLRGAGIIITGKKKSPTHQTS